MLKIIGRRTSANVMKPLWVADELNVPFEQIDMGGSYGGNDQPDYLAMNPMGLVPTIIDDGLVLWESNAMTRYLCEKHGRGSLYPTDPGSRAIADTWMDWKLTTINAMMRPVFWGLVRTPVEDRNHTEINAGIETGCRLWAMLDRHLAGRDFIAGNSLTMGDIPLGPQAHRWLSLVEDRPSMPNLEAWYQRLTDRPAFQKHCMIPIE